MQLGGAEREAANWQRSGPVARNKTYCRTHHQDDRYHQEKAFRDLAANACDIGGVEDH